MLIVLATIELEAGCREEFLREFHRIVPLVRQEAGCLEYGPTVDLPTNLAAQPELRADVVVIVEKWETLDHLEAHLVAPHMLEYRPRVKSLIKQATLHVLQPA